MKFHHFLLFLLVTRLGLAQENISFNKNREIVSPEIHSDNSVTFRLLAPDAKSVKVESDFLPPGPMGKGAVDLKKGSDGVWIFTSDKLPSELYSYQFLVDGLRMNDPNNPFLIRDVAAVVSIFIVGNGKADDYKVKDVPHGTVTRRWYDSPTLKSNRRVTVYMPPGYETSKENYPVLYLMHGAGGDEEAWIALGRTSQILDNLIAAKKAKPMIVVMTNGNASQTAAPGESSAAMTKPIFIQPDMFSGNTEKAYPDVVKFIDANYRTKKEKSGRAITGLSMGGMHSLVISANNPELFDYIGVFSSGIIQPKEASAEVYTNLDSKFKALKEKGVKLYWIGIGKDDFLYKQCGDLKAKLDAANLKYTYKETPGGHTWSNWRDYLTEFAPLLFR